MSGLTMLEPPRRERVGNLSSGSVIRIYPLISGVDSRSSSRIKGLSSSLGNRCFVPAKEFTPELLPKPEVLGRYWLLKLLDGKDSR